MEDPAVTTFGKVLRQERKRKEMNQTQLAELIGTTQQNIGHWEAGRTMPKQESFEKLLGVFGQDSPLSNLSPRDEIRLHMKALEQATSKEQRVGPMPASRLLASTDATQHRLAIVGALKAGLPSHLRHFVGKPLEFKGFKYLADYLSPTLCVKAYTPSDDRNVLVAARLGMQTMLMLRAALKEQDPQGDKDRSYILAIVATQSSSRWVNGAWRRIHTEAEALGLMACLAFNWEGIGSIVERIEAVGYTQFMAEINPNDGDDEY